MSKFVRPFVSALVLSAFSALALSFSAYAADTGQKAEDSTIKDPAALVEKVSSQIIHALEANKAKIKENPEFVQQLVKKYLLPHFDFDLTSQLVLGRYWRMATPEQRKAFQEAFLHYLTATYSKGLQKFDKVKVEVLPFRGDISKRYVKVRSKIILPDRPPVEVNYALVKHDDGWKVFDFIIEGVSYVHTYQTQFQSEIRHTSLESLINRLQNAKAPASLTEMKAATPSTAGGA